MKVKDFPILGDGMNSTLFFLILVKFYFLFDIDFAQEFQRF